MSDFMFNRSTNVVRILLKEKLQNGDAVIDCTLGNGHDALYMKELIGQEGQLYGFDVQTAAIEKTSVKLADQGYDENIKLILDSHENVDLHVKEKVDVITFNFGYLPGGDKSIVTKSESSIKALEKCFYLLKDYGIIALIFYPGHEEGKKELMEMMAYLQNIDQKKFDIHHGRFINQANNPPEYMVIQKRTRS